MQIQIRYDKTGQIMEIYDKANEQHYEASDVEDFLGQGVTVEHEEEFITIGVEEKYLIQVKANDSYHPLAECMIENVDMVFACFWYTHPSKTFRVLRNSDHGLYGKYDPADGAVVGLI